MTHSKKIIVTIVLLATLTGAMAQEPLTLDQCRSRALQANRSLKAGEEKKAETKALEKAALWQMLPKVSANGAYLWTDRSVSLLSEDQQTELTNLGTRVQTDISQAIHEEFSALPIGGQWIADRLSALMQNGNMTSALNDLGSRLTQDLETDTRNLFVGAVTVTQPIYLGGKLLAIYRTSQLMNELSGIQYDKQREETLISVDEAYWQVVSVKHKQALAQRYADLLDTLNRNVEEMVQAEVATQGDLAKVRVKFNEAQMSLTKANNGLALAKMLLAQRCGMPLDTIYDIYDGIDENALHTADTLPSMEEVWQNRREMQMLRISDSITGQAVRIAASTLKPNVIATAGYMFSRPNVFDGFQNEWGGTLMAGVVVNIPIAHPGGIYSLKAAKAKRREVGYQIEEAREMIELQVTKLNYELELAYKKLEQAQSSLTHAEENLRLADESFKAGMCSSTDLMGAQTAWTQAQGEVIDAQIEIEMSRVYLRQALGK